MSNLARHHLLKRGLVESKISTQFITNDDELVCQFCLTAKPLKPHQAELTFHVVCQNTHISGGVNVANHVEKCTFASAGHTNAKAPLTYPRSMGTICHLTSDVTRCLHIELLWRIKHAPNLCQKPRLVHLRPSTSENGKTCP